MSDLLSMLGQLHSAGRLTPEEEETYYRLRDLKVDRVDLVRQGANGRQRFAVVKGTNDMSTQPEHDPGIGAEVVPDGQGGYMLVQSLEKAIALPGPVKEGLLKRFTEAQERLASLISMIKGASSAPPNAPMPAEIGREAKAIADHISGSAARYPSPKTASPGGEEKQSMAKEQPAVEDGNTTDLAAIEKQAEVLRAMIEKKGARLSAKTLERLRAADKELQKILHEESNPALAALTKGVAENKQELQEIKALLAKALGADDPQPDPAADPAPAPVAKDADPAPQPAAQPVAGSQASQPAPVQPLAKDADDVGDPIHYHGDLNDLSDEDL